MHGYIDSFPVPLRAASITNGPTASSSKSQKAKGKERDIHGQSQAQSSAAAYDVVANWSDQEKREVERKVLMAARRELKLEGANLLPTGLADADRFATLCSWILNHRPHAAHPAYYKSQQSHLSDSIVPRNGSSNS